ncbi:DeoR/GlpR transcriptional regulator [Crassaminicella thermophila]|uniref:DeoR/GlpR transcriptional regulator n=1 Tax=Crassaminicella thermophila TaxID=2599308 RepID=A0A5C0SIN2_CRATE|nr:DeoR/GlpR family DNA-binding transcription regulator [Crassaminicella thermophila]QEK13068.1 DeoR/GlpR transcriptional regulator [Crassaminicella thermophila]
MLAEKRKDRILQILEEDGSVKVSKLTKLFDVSIETIRRDLETLEKEGLLKRVYGGAVLKKNKVHQLNYVKREKEFADEKKEIAKIAIRYIEEGQSIALNNGTTNIEIARELKKNFKELTVITNSLMIASELADVDSFTIILTGGILNNKEYAFYGDLSENVLSDFIVDKAFISVGGVSLTRGITDYLPGEVQIEKKLIEISQEVIILADSSKIDSVSLIKVTDIHEANLVITDSKLDDKILNKYLKNGIEIVKE